jgi:riboflavin kinase/FMN adenylyltransferase
MRLFRETPAFSALSPGTALALGNFDGLHRGHRCVIDQALKIARQRGTLAGVVTFEPHPRRFFDPDAPARRLLPFRRKMEILREWGVDFVRLVRFDHALSRMSPEDFVQDILLKELRAGYLVAGEDFVFGHRRAGNASLLESLSARLGYEAHLVAPVRQDGVRVSSTHIRALLGEGRMEEAARFLGYAYRLSGHIRHGDKRGGKIGYPTANLYPHRLFLPRYGVYAVRAEIGGKTLGGVANLGIRPSFGGETPSFETHFFDWSGALYGLRLDIELLRFLRPERKFADIAELVAQIGRDAEAARAEFS